MCCFSRPVTFVSDTKIFARLTGVGTQMLAYEMRFGAAGDLAMILPLPVPPGSPESAVRFIDLQAFPELFTQLAAGFPAETIALRSRSGRGPRSNSAPTLVVHDVGEFEASFVPTLADFDRLDDRFRLPAGVWESLPGYADHGFAVFKLRDARSSLRRLLGRGRGRSVHPMAFEMPTRDPRRAFFPTVHIHDGTVRPQARFSHSLYLQGVAEPDPAQWVRSLAPASAFISPEHAKGLVDGESYCYRRSMMGLLDNADVWV